MKARGLLILSVAANVGLAIGWMVYAHGEKDKLAQAQQQPEGESVRYKTNVVVRRQFLNWSQLESPDYATYVANLRAVDCPEQTVRDIIIADVNAHYARRLALEVTTPDQQWWRTEADTNVLAIAEAKTAALDDERRALLAQLLGPNWEGGDLINLPRPTQAALTLDGPVLGNLPEAVKESVAEVSVRGEQRIQDYLAAQRAAGREPDPAMLTKLDEQTRLELAAVLTPQQVEEYQLRYSATADGLRNELGDMKYFNASPEEFQKLYHVVEDINNKLAAVSDADPNAAQIRAALIEQRLAATKAALGSKRYAEYLKLHDPTYVEAVAAAQTGGAPQSADTIYEINHAASEQQVAISNANLTAELKTVEQKKVELLQAQGNAAALGQQPMEAPPMPPMPPTSSYTLSIGENLNTVAQRAGVSVNVLQFLNPGVDLSNVRPGDKINLPAR